jgi:hypothetical protein
MNRFTTYKDLKKLFIGLIIFFLIVFSMFLFSCSNNEKQTEQQRFTRKNANSPEAINDLLALNKALDIMRKKDCKDPLSWYYQGAIHWVPDTIKNNRWCGAYHNVGDKMDGWDNCTHTPSGKEKLHFLVWHRLYIWHFEKIVRKLSGYNDFALPYWAYTNNNDRDRCIPDLFRDKHSSLFEEARYDSLNDGWPVSGEISRALDLTKIMSYTDYKMFCLNINNAPHGAMHDYIGAGNDTTGTLQFNNSITGTTTNTGLMGWVPTAAFDPIFWTHHSNIDRIWQQWHNSNNGQPVTIEQLEEVEWPYVFFNENGEKVVYSLEEALDIIYTMDYDFDDTPVKTKEVRLMDEAEPKLFAQSTPGTKVSGKITTGIKVLGLTQINLTSTKKVKLEVVVSFTKVPKGVYEVYVNENGVCNPTNSTFAGFMNFFGADHKMSGKSCEKGCCRKLNKSGRPEFTFEYEVPASAEYNITIYKDNGKHTGDLTIDKVSIIK